MKNRKRITLAILVLLGVCATVARAQQTNVTVNVNNDSALAEKQRITAENERAIGQAIGRGILAGIEAAKLRKETKKAVAWCAAHPGPDHGYHFSNSTNVSCDGGVVTFHEPGWTPTHK